MKKTDIFQYIDHTELRRDATFSDITLLIDEAKEFRTASVCIPPYFVENAHSYAKDDVKICTVVGFPNGYVTTGSKCFETLEAVKQGASEIDMVINSALLKEKNAKELLLEINAIKSACRGALLKVIVEACMLTHDEKIFISEIVSESSADYIKTSTGFSSGGATLEDVELFAKYCKGKKIKAAGGIKSPSDAVRFINAGAARLGSSSLLKMLLTAEDEII